MPLLPSRITVPVARLGAAAQNALEVARFGGLDTEEQPSAYEVAAEHRVYRLRHYYPSSDGNENGSDTAAPAVLLVPPMMLAAEIYDVSPATSAVTILHDRGIDPWVVDFGSPEDEAGGLERTLADHVRAVSDAVDTVRELTGRDVHLGGYSQGGMFCYQVAAYRRDDGLVSLITFGSPVDTRLGMPFGIPENFAAGIATVFADRVFRSAALPAWASRTGFQLLDPIKSARSRIEFLMQLHDRESLLPRERQRRFLQDDGWVAWPGPAMADFLRQFVAHNRMLEGGFVIDERLLTLADIGTPIMSVVGTVDEIAPAAGVRAIRLAAPRAEVWELALDAGHFGLVVGSAANHTTWPTVAAWMHWREQPGKAPEGLTEVSDDDVPAELSGAGSARLRNRVGYGLELAGAVSGGMARSVAGTARRSARGLGTLSREAAGALPRLTRLEQVQPGTRISLGLLVQERMRRTPEELLFLFEDRAHTARDVNERIDNVVRGLISIGVRQGEHVGVLMGSRPSALALVTALNRLGAVAVLLRPDGNTEREAVLGQVRRIIADPERAAQAVPSAHPPTVHTFVLGGGADPRELDVPLTADMEQIDPRQVRLPKWYRPNPGTAGDLAFIVFTGSGDDVRMSRITNGRWVTSALGTASSAALTRADTVYSLTPLYHPSGLMVSIGSAIAGGARLAMASSFEPETFWEEVRRYGVTVVSYTWTLLHDLVEAAPQSGERHHPVRLFIGSGMPPNLWRRVRRRFAPARVVEFYASTETGAVLVNLRDAKPGAMGRRLPGSPELRLGAYDPDAEQLRLGDGGFVRACGTDEVGILLARARTVDTIATTPLRGVFARGDAWLSTGDLFKRDSDGDYWRLDSVRDVIHTASGPVYTAPIRDALGDLPAVDLSVAYAVALDGERPDLAVAALTLRAGGELDSRSLGDALQRLPAPARPDVVHVVGQIPVTTWYRPLTGPLRAAGLPKASSAAHPVWYRDRGGRRYRPLTASARRRLVTSG
ncbi:MAG: AMP-binding protein [Solirubrobacteraceae bacterium]